MKKTTKKPFSEPKMNKCEQPLDKVTMTLGSYCGGDEPTGTWPKKVL
jgi:hypothetical protein